MDSVYNKALKKKRELEKALEEVNSFLRMYEQLSETKEEQTVSGFANSEPVDKKSNQEGNRRRQLKPAEIADIAERVIRENGRPMQRGELVAALEARDVDLPSQDKPRYVGTILWREADRFVNLTGRGYVMKDMADETDVLMDELGRIVGGEDPGD